MTIKPERKVALHIRTKLYKKACIVGSNKKQWVVDINAWVDNPDGTMRWRPNTSFAFHSAKKPNLESELFLILCASGLIDYDHQA